MKLKIRRNFKILLIIIIINIIFEVVLIGAASEQGDSSQIPSTPQALTVTQRLDHFNKSESRLWGQRYFISGQYYTGDGPVFVLVGGDVVATISWLNKKYQWTEMAERFNALCFYVEQRFFGESQPTGDLSLDSLKYFTLNQALEDLVDFRASMEYQYKLNNKQWIFFGNVNGALLATNLRIKYPGLVTGVVASCPRMIFKLNNSDLLSAAFKVLEKASSTCVPAITNAVNQIQDAINEGPDGWADLNSKFQVCGSLDGNNDRQVQDFFYLLASQIYKIVSRNAEDDQDVTAELLCNIMNNSLKGPEIDRLAQLMKLYLKSKKTGCIFELYDSMVKKTKDTSLSSLYKEGRKNWYRICTENPYFFGSNDRNMPFFSKFSLSFIIERCADIFGSKFNVNFIIAGINATNQHFGYKTIDADLTNVLFVSGADDPEKSTHILQDINTDVKAIVIAGESHCTDMYPTTINDSKDLIKARSSIVHEIGNWINS